MSDYVHKKAIRLPITEPLIRKVCFSNSVDFIEQDIEDFIENLKPSNPKIKKDTPTPPQKEQDKIFKIKIKHL